MKDESVWKRTGRQTQTSHALECEDKRKNDMPIKMSFSVIFEGDRYDKFNLGKVVHLLSHDRSKHI